MSDPRYPIGKHQRKEQLTSEERQAAIDTIAAAPAALRAAVQGLSEEQIDTPYREGGWTVRQVVHHVPDSHMNAYCRIKFGLTEDAPLVKAYDENAWAQLPDSLQTPAETSLTLLESLHDRWVRLLRATPDADFARTITHPEHGQITVDSLLGLYAWHGRHHVGHITALRERMGW